MNSLTLDLSDSDVADALADCETGEKVKFTVEGTLTKTDKLAVVDIDTVEYSGAKDEEETPAEEATETPEVEAEEDAAKSKVPPAVKKVSKY